MRSIVRAGAVVAMTTAALCAVSGTASAAGPSPKASCVGQVFVPQATAAPRQVALQIAHVKAFLVPEGDSFGDAIADNLARETWCRQG